MAAEGSSNGLQPSGNCTAPYPPEGMFNAQALADAQLLFQLVDTETDGKLDANELTNHLSDMGVPNHDIDGLFYNLDQNGDGQVTKQEFIVGYNKYHETLDNAPAMSRIRAYRQSVDGNAQTYADAQLVFDLADTDKNGRLDSNELTAHLTDIGIPAQDIETLLFSLDTDGDSFVSKQEFVAGYNQYYDGVTRGVNSGAAAASTASVAPAQISPDPDFAVSISPSDPLDDSWLLADIQALCQQPGMPLVDQNGNGQVTKQEFDSCFVSELPAAVKPEPQQQQVWQQPTASGVKPEPQQQQMWPTGVGPKEPAADVLLQNAHGFVMMSFDAMAVVAGETGVVLSSNPAFLKMAFTLGGGDQAQGMWMLQQHFLRDLYMPSGAQIGYSSQDLQVHGDTVMMTVNSAIKTMSAPDAPSQSLLWVLTARPGETAELVINDPKLADPQIKVVMDPRDQRRKRPKAAKQTEYTGSMAEVQKLWQKYGERAVNSHKKQSNQRIMRAYYRCYNQDCPARLTVDSCSDTGNQVDASSGAHNHLVTLAPDD